MAKKKVNDLKEPKDVTLKTGRSRKSTPSSSVNDEGTSSPGASLVLRSSSRLKEKVTADQMITPEDGTVEKANPKKRRGTSKETLTKKKVEDARKSKCLASKRGHHGKSKRDDGAENDGEGTDSVGTSKVVRSSNRLKVKANTDIQAEEKGKGKRKQAPEDSNEELIKSPQKKLKTDSLIKKKFDEPKKSEGVASKRGRYGKSKRGVSTEDDEEKTDSAGTSKFSRSSNRLKAKTNADEQDKREETRDINAETNKTPHKMTKKKVRNQKISGDMASKKVSRSSNRLNGKANADKSSNETDKGKRNQAPGNRTVETDKTPQKRTRERSGSAGTNKARGKAKADIGQTKGGQAKVEKRKMPGRTCRSNSKTKN